MNIMRQMNESMNWTYYTASIRAVPMPPFSFNASLEVNLSVPVDPAGLLFAAQLYNALPVASRPSLMTASVGPTPDPATGGQWNAWAAFRAAAAPYRLTGPDAAGNVTVTGLSSMLIEARYQATEVPATRVQTDVSAADYTGGRPAIISVEAEGAAASCEQAAVFARVATCRSTVAVPVMVDVTPAYGAAPLYTGRLSGLRSFRPPAAADLQVQLRDYGQPRPYAPAFSDFGVVFFLGLSFLLGAFFSVVAWWCLRFYVVNKNVRENDGAPPMFFQGMLRYRGW